MKTKASFIKLPFIPKQLFSFLLLSATGFAACNDHESNFDASGSFEAVETIISSEVSGTIQQLNIEEGQILQAGQTIGYIDSVQLFLKKKQLEAQLKATGKKLPNITVQTGYYNQQEAVVQSRLKNLLYEQKRFQNLVNAGAATQKQLDDINAQIDETQKQLQVTAKQKEAQVSTLQTQSSSVTGDLGPLEVQVEQINDQLKKCTIINPVNGTVLTKYSEANEMVIPGKSLYKIADLSSIILRAYITGEQLPQVKLNQKVKVFTDAADGKYKETEGIITWINDKAEFTPKTIQTKDERANMVYAIKVKVKNDGTFKIGMYAELKFLPGNTN